ncbi:MAG: hypothetical protein ACKVK9_08570 [Nitrospinaceae bacterium]
MAITLGDSSMVRLGKYFTIMLMIYGDYRRYDHSTVSGRTKHPAPRI